MPNDAPSSSLPAFEVGQKLAGVYVLRKQISGDDQSQIWLAQDEVLGKDVSLHFIPTILRQDERGMGELRQEIKRNRQLIHPGILRVYDLVEEPEWSAISMDWFEGESLANQLKAKPGGFFEPADVKPWLQQVCHTLDDIHKIQIVHRDVAPHNIFADAKGKVLIAKFGISRVIEDALSRLKKDGGASAHLASLSPQCLDGEHPSKSDDIYSIGATIYELLTGELPFKGADLVAQIRKNPPQSMMERRAQLGRKGGTILPVWEKWVAAALAKGTAERPASAGELAAKLGLSGKLSGEAAAAPAKEPEAPAPATPVVEAAAAGAAAAIAGVATAAEAKETAPAEAKAGAPEAAPEIKLPSPPAEAPAEHGAAKVEKGPEVEMFDREEEEDEELRASTKPPEKKETPAPAERTGPSSALVFGVLIVLVAVVAYLLNRPDETDKKKLASGPAVNATVAPTPPKPKPADVPAVVKSATPAKHADEVPTPERLSGEPLLVEKKATPMPVATPVKVNPPVAVSVANNPPPAAIAAGEDDKDYLNALKQKQLAEAALTEAENAVKKKATDIEPVVKAAAPLQTQRTERADQLKAAEEAAAAARQAAEAKAKSLDDAKKALADWEASNAPKLAALEKATTEFRALQSAMTEKQEQAAAASKAAADAEAAHLQKVAAKKKAAEEAEMARKKAEDDEKQAKLAAQRAAEEEAARLAKEKLAAQRAAEEEAARLAKEKADRDAKINEQIAAIQKQLQDLQKLKDEPTKPIPAKLETATPAPVKPVPATPAPKVTATPVATPKTMPPAPPAPQPVRQTGVQSEFMPTVPGTAATPAPALPLATATPRIIYSNPPATPAPPATAEAAPDVAKGESSLGLKFAPVGDVFFCLWPTRYKDFDTFVKESGYRAVSWRSPGFKQGPEHPVVNVSWNDAIAFCKWLTDRDRKMGFLTPNQSYRLPTDLEWSRAVGLPEEIGKTPEARDMGVADVFPWGTQWPPPPNVGNYTGEETGSDVAIKGYDDGFAWTSPVGTFPPNKLGLYDVGGNVWQWCMDNWSSESKAKVLRGASWYNGALKLSLLSSCRVHANPESSTDNYGFRIVRVTESSKNKR